MRDMIGGAEWVAVWTMQMAWLVATMTIAVGAMAMAELLIAGRARRAQAKLPRLMATLDPRCRERPHLKFTEAKELP